MIKENTIAYKDIQQVSTNSVLFDED